MKGINSLAPNEEFKILAQILKKNNDLQLVMKKYLVLMWKIKWEYLKLSHTSQVSQNVPTERKHVELLFTTHQSSRRDGLWVVNYVSGKFSFRRNDLCYATILNTPD